MKHSLRFVGLFAVFFGLLCSTISAAPAPKGFQTFQNGVAAPKTIFFDESGTPITIDKFNGKIVILNLWATWCGPCVKEMPSLERLAARLPTEQFAVVAVSQDKGGSAVSKPFLDRIEVKSLAVYADPIGRLYRDFGARGMPSTFIVAPNGQLIAAFEGAAEWDDANIVNFLLTLNR